jgi:hypothetical protein
MAITITIRCLLLKTVTIFANVMLVVAPVFATSLMTVSEGLDIQGISRPDIVLADWAEFENNVKVHVKEKSYGIKVMTTGRAGDGNYFNLQDKLSNDIQGGGYLLKARIDTDGNLIDGIVKITGTTNTRFGRVSGVLMTAKLDDLHEFDGMDWDYNPDQIGFGIYDVTCHSVIESFTTCASAGSVDLSLNERGGLNGFENYKSNGLAVTTLGVAAVPVPAAAWLFGSGLLGLLGAARRKLI